jgi:hypothetical protein
LTDDERILRAMLRASGTQRSASHASARRKRASNRAKQRRDAEQNRSGQRHYQCETERASVERNCIEARQPLRRERKQTLQRTVRHDETRATPPSSASSRCSDGSDRAMRHEPAPSAARTSSSERFCSPRTSSRFATLALAINNTSDHRHHDPEHIAYAAMTSSLSGRSAGVMRQVSR